MMVIPLYSDYVKYTWMNKMKTDLTVVILTKDESIHIKRCINSLIGIAKRIVVVDSFSTDKTLEYLAQYGDVVSVYQRAWKNYSDQFQWGLDNTNINTRWVMRMDADEYIESDLAIEIPVILSSGKSSNINGFYIRRKYFYKDKWIKYGGIYPLNLLRIWRNGIGRIESRWMDEHIVISEQKTMMLKGHIVDHNMNGIVWWSQKHIGYATREAIDLLNIKYRFLESDDAVRKGTMDQANLKRIIKEDIYGNIPTSLRSLLYFIYRYIFRLGFLDGSAGWDFHFLQGFWYRTLVDVRYKELDKLISKVEDNSEKIQILASNTGLSLN